MAFLYEDELIRTASVERVVAPISTHLCHLILLCESGEDPELFTHLEPAARLVAKASKNMAAVASKLVADSSDEALRAEMAPLVEALTVAGQHVLLATQKLSIEPIVRGHRDELIIAAQNTLHGVVKILLAEDDAAVRKITAASQWLLDCLSNTGAAEDMATLLKAFQVFSKAMLLFHDLVVERMQDLRDQKQREHVKTSLVTLSKCISMLHTAMSTTIKHPTSEEVQDAKKYILHQVDSTVKDIISTLKSKCYWSASGPNGYYTEKRNSLLRLLSELNPSSFCDSSFDVVLRDLLFHCMAVANTSRREVQSEIVYNCKLVLQLWSEMSQQTTHPEEDLQPKELPEHLCSSIIQLIHRLDEVVVTAVLWQVLDVFVLASTPLEQLVNTVNCLLDGEPETELELDPLQPFSRAFITHADRMAQVAGFISAFATDRKSLDSVETSKVYLMRLKEGVTSVLLELEGDSVQGYGALQKLLELHQRWTEETEQLLRTLSDVVNVREFAGLAVQAMETVWAGCNEAYKKKQDFLKFCKSGSFLIGHMSQMIYFVRGHIDRSDDPIYRNGLLVLVRQAEESAAEVTGAISDIYSDNSLNEEAFSSLSHSVLAGIKAFSILQEGLDGLQHPHILSPLREDARKPVVLPSVSPAPEPQHTADGLEIAKPTSQAADNKHISMKCNSKSLHREADEAIVLNLDSVDFGMQTFLVDAKSQHDQTEKPKNIETSLTRRSQNTSLLPLLCNVVSMTNGRNVEALNVACTDVLELSNCYSQAAKEAASIVDTADNQEVESLRSELVALTPRLVQTAQETAMSSGMSTDSIYRHSIQFSDIIENTRKILLPVAGIWYHAILAMLHSHAPTTVETSTRELAELICLCADVVHVISSLDIEVRGEVHETITALHNKLTKAQTNTKRLSDLIASSTPGRPDELEGPCILWALSIQVLLSSLDKILGIATPRSKEQLIKHQLMPQKWLTAMSENSLRIQEATRMSSLNCRDNHRVKVLSELQVEVKTLTDVYLQAAESLGTVSVSGVLPLARTEFLQRELQGKMKALSGLLGKVNKDYVTAIEDTFSLAYVAATQGQTDEAEEKQENFEQTAGLLLENTQAATKQIEDCLNFIRDPRERSHLRFINDHLVLQMSDIVSQARLIVETRSIGETLTVEIQTQCWAAKAHYLVAELYKVDGILQESKKQIRLGLQGQRAGEAANTPGKVITMKIEATCPSNAGMNVWQGSSITKATKPSMNIQAVPKQELTDRPSQRTERVSVFSAGAPSLTYTSLFLKQETDRWDNNGNQIIKVTKEMAEKIYHMAQYLKRRGPMQSKEAFVTSAKDLISNGQTITQFVQVIAEHCLDKHCTEELSVIADQILTITSQLTIISSVNAVTPGCTSSDEILVKNAQNLLQTVIRGVRAAESACIRGLRQPEPNSDAAKAAALCFQWRRNLLLHRAQQQLNPETDDLGLRKTATGPAAPSLAPSTNVLNRYK